MYIVLWMAAIIIMYIVTFKDDFTQEHIEKVSTFAILVSAAAFALALLISILSR